MPESFSPAWQSLAGNDLVVPGLVLLACLFWSFWRLGRQRREGRRLQEELRDARDEQLILYRDLGQAQAECAQLRERLDEARAMSQQPAPAIEQAYVALREQLDGFQKRIDHVHDEAVRGNAALAAQIGQVGDLGRQLGEQAESLAGALRGDNKLMGNWGEFQLERTLQMAGLEPGVHYRAQPSYVDAAGQRRQPDFVLDLPDGRHLVIDSKVSLLDYERAQAQTGPEARQQALEAHVRSVRRHIDDLASREYGHLEGMRSPGFVFLYMPVEAAYIEALRQAPELVDHAWRQQVALVSHTTLLPVLRTVAHVWTMVRSHEQAHELAGHAGELHRQVARVAERLKRLGAGLGAVSRHYNDVVTAVAGQQGLSARVSRFAQVSDRASRDLPVVEPLDVALDDDRLQDGSEPGSGV